MYRSHLSSITPAVTRELRAVKMQDAVARHIPAFLAASRRQVAPVRDVRVPPTRTSRDLVPSWLTPL